MNADPAPAPSRPLQGDAALLRAVGSLALTAAVINIIVGGGIFKMPSALSLQMGAAAPLALVVGALVMVPIVLCFAAVGSRASATGGPYTYVSTVFGTLPGFLAGALTWTCNAASSAGVAVALSLQVASVLPVFAQPGPRALLLAAVYGLMFALNAFGVKLGARAITALAALKLAPLFLLVAAGVWFVDWSQVSFRVADVPSWTALGSAMVMVVFAYSGIETALVPTGEVRDPSRSVPRAALVAIVLVVLLYLGLQIVTQGVLGGALATSGVPIADTAGRLWSPAHGVLLATAGVSMAGFLLGNLLGSSRLLFALGRDGYLPRAFSRVSATHRVPLLALAVHAVVAWGLAAIGSFETLVLISGGAVCLVYILVCVAAWRAQRIDLRERGAPFVLKGGPLVPLVAVGGMTAILTTLTPREWLAIGVAVAVLAVVYAALAGQRRRQPDLWP